MNYGVKLILKYKNFNFRGLWHSTKFYKDVLQKVTDMIVLESSMSFFTVTLNLLIESHT